MALAAAGSMPAGAASSGLPIATRMATFEPIEWAGVPGWAQESHVDALRAFNQACGRLRSRPLWGPICKDASAQPKQIDAARRFFETHFSAYRVTDRSGGMRPADGVDPAATGNGLMTGYFEPILDGRREPGGRFIYPVYGTPPSMLHLDARALKPFAGRREIEVVVRDRRVVPVSGPQAGEQTYRLEIGSLPPEPLDRRHRLRIDGDRVVPFQDRDAIEAAPSSLAPVLAWVENPDVLYVMQVQGSGRIRFPDQKELRLAYADQNGHPFTPRAPPTTRTRNIGTEPAEAPSAALLSLIDTTDPASDGGPAAAADPRPAPPPPGVRPRGLASTADREVERVRAEQFYPTCAPSAPPAARPSATRNIAGGAAPTVTATALPSVTHSLSSRAAGIAESNALPPRNNPRSAALALAFLAKARDNDRSYVFFRARNDSAPGPPGALGVPLTAGRSIAVDPRVTPLGAPVFIEARGGAYEVPIRRLVVAQDTGGAIRGAVRADFFWGSGPAAGTQALQTRDALAMWVLLPKGYLEARRPATTRTRGIPGDGGGGGAASSVDCTVPDDEYCDD